ncbi:MAG TPA: DUF2291 domain-containing protein [Cyclobacteriaceae bacterium]|nr:DUF2291 domain-containing protein [Cyclobacteriaceae bacterium]
MKAIVAIVIVGIVAYNSVYFRKLDEHKASGVAKEFDAIGYAKTFWEKKLPQRLDSAIELGVLKEMLSTDPGNAFAQHSHALGIGNLRYFLVKETGVVTNVGSDDIRLDKGVKVATEFIFGNSVRDASGLVNVNEFTNTMDFNNVSAEINKIIREQVLPPFKASVKKESKVKVIGAIELNKEHLDLSDIEIIPVQLELVDTENAGN